MVGFSFPNLEPSESLQHIKALWERHTSIRKHSTVAKRLKQWWFVAENGKLTVNVRYGSRLIELPKGKTAVEVACKADLVPSLELIKQAVEAGELDVQIAAPSKKAA